MLDVCDGIKETATKNIAKAQTKQKEYFDKRHDTEELKPGTKVLVENTYQKQRKGGKWEDLYKGPYVIHECLGKGVYTLKKMDGIVLKSKPPEDCAGRKLDPAHWAENCTYNFIIEHL